MPSASPADALRLRRSGDERPVTPLSNDWLFALTFAEGVDRPAPRASTSGTVTGPVVTAPQSQASATASSGIEVSVTTPTVSAKAAKVDQWSIGMSSQPRVTRIVPIIEAKPTPGAHRQE